MRSALATLSLLMLVAACGSNTASPTPPDEPFGTAPALLPLPGNLAGIPGPAEFTAEVAPHTPADELTVGEFSNFTLGHCGLSSPVDIDGSLWDPVGYRNPDGGALTEQQEGELVNATDAVLRLESQDTLTMSMPSGLTLVLQRHDGPRRYFLCD